MELSMMRRGRAWLLASGILLGSAQAAVPVEDFARHSEINGVALSPSGDYVALAMPTPNGSETQLHIVDLGGKGKSSILRFGKMNHVTGVIWSADDRVTVSRGKMEPLRAAPYSMGELMSSDISGKDQEILFAYIRDDGNIRGRRKDQGYAWVAKVLDHEPGKVLIGYQCWNCGSEPDSVIFKVDTASGQREEVERVKKLADFVFDHQGVARVMWTADDNDEPETSYRPEPTSPWLPLPRNLVGYSLSDGVFDTDNNTLYAVVSDKGEPGKLYRINLRDRTRTQLAGRDDVEIAYTMRAGRNGIPFAVVYNASKPSVQYLDPKSEWAQLHAGLMQRFPGQMVNLLDFTRDGKKVLFSAYSDRHPVAYYLVDRVALQIALVAETRPWINPEQMSATTPVEFKTRDGKTLYGFHTAAGTGVRPMVVLPHGGPHGPYDSWGYEPDVQFLASRGYSVLQVNFRGSGGRGKAFERLGYRQWGGQMMDDIADGVQWAIDSRLADPNRICTFGASYGGYASLMQQVRYPELYKCAIGYVGVYDLHTMYTAGDIKSSERGRRYLERVLGPDDKELDAQSPAKQIDRIKSPVFLVQGRDDQRVPMEQFRALEKAFKSAGIPVETQVVDGEGHGFYDPRNRAELYRRMEIFLQTHAPTSAGD